MTRHDRSERRAHQRGHADSAQPASWPAHLGVLGLRARTDSRYGTSRLTLWLSTAVAEIVTTYSEAGQRVLLLGPPTDLTPATQRSVIECTGQPRSGPHIGLLDAGPSVVRLGRRVQMLIANAHASPINELTADVPVQSESGPEPRANSPTTGRPPWSSVRRRSGPVRTGSAGPGHYELVITTTEPSTLDWFRQTDWTGLLTPTGALAIVAHGCRSYGRLADPAGLLVRAAYDAGLRYIDRIALDERPADRAHIATASTVITVHPEVLVFRLAHEPEPGAAANLRPTEHEISRGVPHRWSPWGSPPADVAASGLANEGLEAA